ncbi:MAG: hypothetical protein WCS94_06370 [Verrucomicrobiota bacterium]
MKLAEEPKKVVTLAQSTLKLFVMVMIISFMPSHGSAGEALEKCLPLASNSNLKEPELLWKGICCLGPGASKPTSVENPLPAAVNVRQQWIWLKVGAGKPVWHQFSCRKTKAQK